MVHPNQYIQYDFYQKRVKLTNYTIYNTNSYKLLHWKVLGSNDGKKWEDIDEQHSKTGELSTYSVNTDKSYKYIRFLQTGVDPVVIVPSHTLDLNFSVN